MKFGTVSKNIMGILMYQMQNSENFRNLENFIEIDIFPCCGNGSFVCI